ncbi:MAG: hypothetical protein SPK52_04990 [Synergistales bacterium]|nr:hypothetical protein [Bacteroidales bacterium]MDY6393792.1 hypothetical protein [Bacteroidales bacterium]MDY6395817.1 hypothetical protein [Bacteroidales bacterium]MDY6435554.1 hypothetical protein [Synergistales bacterium]
MKIKNIIILLVVTLLANVLAFAGNDITEIVLNNVSIKVSSDWTTQKQIQKNGDFRLTCTKDNSNAFVEITCKKRVIDPVVRANDIASERSMQKHFEYMQIDEIQNAKLKKTDTKLLTYTNTYLNDVSKGGIYAFISEGYTYTLEYFGEDNPKTKKELKKVVNSFSVSSPDKTRNIVDLAEDYQDKDWKKYDDTTSLETKVEELGEDLVVINTAKNHKEVGNYVDKENQLTVKIKELEEEQERLNEQLENATEENNQKEIKKIKKKIDTVVKAKEKLEKEFKQNHNDNLKIKLKE